MNRNLHRAGSPTLRLARLFLRRNELRRSSDRLEAALLAGLTAVLAAAVLVAVFLAARTYRTERAAAPKGLRLTDAVLASPGAVLADPFLHQATARATWRLAGGTERSGILTSGTAPGLYGQPAGTSVWVWLDRAGDPVPPPQGSFGVFVTATLSGLAVVAGGAVAALCGYRLGRRGIDRRRLADWSSAWAVTGPEWTSRQ